MSFDSAYCESIIHNLSTTGCVMIVFFLLFHFQRQRLLDSKHLKGAKGGGEGESKSESFPVWRSISEFLLYLQTITKKKLENRMLTFKLSS